MWDKSTQKKEDRICKIAIRKAGMKQDDIASLFVCFVALRPKSTAMVMAGH